LPAIQSINQSINNRLISRKFPAVKSRRSWRGWGRLGYSYLFK